MLAGPTSRNSRMAQIGVIALLSKVTKKIYMKLLKGDRWRWICNELKEGDRMNMIMN